ncbi:Bsp6I family type II restriction endonuclease [Ureaplasma parvum]|uniref:Bsp6I family type II restriction endonuclease n=1 Tax=Ureaplasma parvum TaxID=134821 RepID=UPI0026EC016A|nr:Bsp6I family type II restriction endonuclease [Ureaplasma parvum]
MNKKLKSLGGRDLNIPDVFSEALFCLTFNVLRTNGTAYSYDCVIRDISEGVQLKSASIPNDYTSFGPTSTCDLLYFADFDANGKVDGLVKFYKIEDDDVYNLVLNAKKGEKFKDQQAQERRPRFSI